MSEGKGYSVIVKLNAAPTAQYASGNSVIFQGDTTEEVATLIAKAVPGGIGGALIIAHFAEVALAQAVGAALRGGNVVADAVGPLVPGADQAASGSALGSTKAAASPAGAAKAKPAPAVDPNAPASLALRKVAANKQGLSGPADLPSGLTTAEAKEIIKG